jgi:hypothetical protein
MTEKRSPDDPEQAKRFAEAAREAEADESGKLFRRAMRKVLPKPKKRRTRQSP